MNVSLGMCICTYMYIHALKFPTASMKEEIKRREKS